MREVEKEVMLVDNDFSPTTAMHQHMCYTQTNPDSMAVDSFQQQHTSEPHVLKAIKKLEVEVLCTQHNPVSPTSI